MKEIDLEKILTRPTTDETMDQKITDSLLNIDMNSGDMDSNIKNNSRSNNFNKSFRLSRVAVIVMALIVIGTGTVLAAARHFVKSYPFKMDIMTEEEYEEKIGDVPSVEDMYGEDTIRKHFGGGNKMMASVPLLKDPDGNLLEVKEINDEGYVVLADGSTYKPVHEFYTPDPDRHEKAKKSGDESFAEMGYPNLVPTYIYDNYVLGEKGFCNFERTKDGYTYKWSMTEFFTDAYDTGDFTSETIWVNFSAAQQSTKNATSTLIDDNRTEDDYAYSTYTTKGGVLISISEHIGGNIIAHIVFDSDTIGNGFLSIEFIGFSGKMDKVKEILDTLPLTEDNIDFQVIAEE